MKKKKKHVSRGKLTSILLFFCALSLSAQKEEVHTDSFYYRKTFDFSHIHNDSLIHYGRKMQMSEDRCFVVRGLIAEAKAYYQRNDFKKSKDHLYLALLRNNQIQSSNSCWNENLINIYRRLFYIYKKENNYPKALEYLSKREVVVNNLPSKGYYYKINKLNILYSEASLKTDLGLFDQAVKILMRAKKSSLKINRDQLNEEESTKLIFYEANVHNTLGNIYVNTFRKRQDKVHLLDSAQSSYKKAYDLIKPIPNTHTEPLYLIRRAKISLLREDYTLAMKQLNQYQELESEYPEYLYRVYYFKSITHWHLKNYHAAISFGQAYLRHHRKNPARETFLLTIYDNLTKSYRALNNNTLALKYSSLGMETFKRLEEKKGETLANIFELDRAEKEEMAKMNQILLSEQKRPDIFAYLFLSMMLIGGTLLFIYFRKKNSLKQTVISERKVKGEVEEQEKKTYKRALDKNVSNTILKKLSQFEKTQDYLSHNFNKQDLASYAETNTTYLSIVLNTHKDQTFQQYIAHLRIQYITEQLRTNRKFLRYSIKAVAEEAGYQNASAFTRKFKDVMGVTPSQYIKNLELEESAITEI